MSQGRLTTCSSIHQYDIHACNYDPLSQPISHLVHNTSILHNTFSAYKAHLYALHIRPYCAIGDQEGGDALRYQHGSRLPPMKQRKRRDGRIIIRAPHILANYPSILIAPLPFSGGASLCYDDIELLGLRPGLQQQCHDYAGEAMSKHRAAILYEGMAYLCNASARGF